MLKKLIAPMEEDEFFNVYWEKKALVIKHKDPEYFSDILTYDILDEFITRRSLEPNSVRIKKESSKNKIKKCIFGQTLSQAHLYKFYDEGYTIILGNAESFWEPLRNLCMDLEDSFKCKKVPSSIFQTPPGSRALKPHYDTEDLFIVQAGGQKHWKLYDSPIGLPKREHRTYEDYYPKDRQFSNPSMEVELNPGDVLYVPRGLLHEAETLDQPSLHITLGVLNVPTWGEMLNHALDILNESHPELAQCLPLMLQLDEGIKTLDHTTPKEVENLFKKYVQELLDPKIISVAFDRWKKIWGSRREQNIKNNGLRLRNQLHTLDKLDLLSLNTSIKAQVSLQYYLEESQGKVAITFHNTKMVVSQEELMDFQYIMSQESCKIRELPSNQSDEEKLKFIQRLIREYAVTLDKVVEQT